MKVNKDFQTRIDKFNKECSDEILYSKLSAQEATFKGKREEPIHSWFRLTPSFSPHLVRIIKNELECKEESVILDPFAGIGTVNIEAKRNGFDSIAVEINPVFHEMIEISTTWEFNIQRLSEITKNYIDQIKKRKNELKDVDLKNFPEIGINLPKIHDVFRWWRKEVLKDLLIARELIKDQKLPLKYKNFLKGGLMSILLEVANIIRGHPTIAFLDNPAYKKKYGEAKKEVNVLNTLESRLHKMITELQEVQRAGKSGYVFNILGDSRNLAKILQDVPLPELIITSPPYPNRYSYVMETRPYLYFFGIFDKPYQGSELDKETIGGTWGKATFSLKDTTVKLENEFLLKIIGKIDSEIRKKSNILANYVTKYFNDMFEHLKCLTEIESELKVAYVIGNSRIKGVEIPTDIIYKEILEENGFKVNKIWRTRKRQGKKGLYDVIIYAHK